MILAFADDSSVCVFDTITQANSYCEAIDVQDEIFVFIDDRRFELKPVFTHPPEQKKVLFIETVSSGVFILQRTEKRREDLVKKLESGEIRFDCGPTAIRSVLNLRMSAPRLFHR